MTRFKGWYDNQNDTTKAWLDKQAIWHDKDMYIALVIGIIIGLGVGILV